MPAHPSMRAPSPRTGRPLRRLPRPGRSTPTTTPALPPSTRTSSCACSLKWRICAGGPIARSPMPASTASPTSRATSWPCPTTWLARSGHSTPSCGSKPTPEPSALLEGVELTERELAKVLEKHGVKKFEPLGREVRSQPASGDVRDSRCLAARGQRRPGGAARLHDRRPRVAAGARRGGERRTEARGRAARERQWRSRAQTVELACPVWLEANSCRALGLFSSPLWGGEQTVIAA